MVRAVVLVAILLAATSAFGQVENNLVDVSGGYALGSGSGLTANGWYGDVGIRAYKSLYVVGGVAGLYYSTTQVVSGQSVQASANSFNVGGGPRVFLTRRHPVVSPFVDVLLSFNHANAEARNLTTGQQAALTMNGFGLDIGGGAQFRINKTFSIRVRPGYSMSRTEGETSSSFLLLSGVVLHFGE